jgi:hypothetical protein
LGGKTTVCWSDLVYGMVKNKKGISKLEALMMTTNGHSKENGMGTEQTR